MGKVSSIEIEMVCNVSRVPCDIKNNILTKTSNLILENNFKLTKAVEFLNSYYDALRFTDINSLYGTSIKKLECFRYYQYFLPWYHYKPVTSFRDDAFITKISQEAILEKVKKIKNLLLSIKNKGYSPDSYKDRKNGHITGYFLKTKTIERFYVVSGNHRAAVLSTLGYEKVPILYENIAFFKERDRANFGYKHIPTSFLEEKASEWPSVKSGFLSEKESLEIFYKYINGGGNV